MKPSAQESLPQKILLPTKQILFAESLQRVRSTHLLEALQAEVSRTPISDLDSELHSLVDEGYLRRLAAFGLRGELVFPVPCLIERKPSLSGYYRLLMGFSEKDSSRAGLGRWLGMETDATPRRISDHQQVRDFCKTMIRAAYHLLDTLDDLSLTLLHELTLLSLGARFQGIYNNLIGNESAHAVFELIISLVLRCQPEVERRQDRVMAFRNASGRMVTVRLAVDPDILATEEISNRIRHVLAIEIKGGRDSSNALNRLGEAEKTHLKYKQLHRGVQCWTVVGVDQIDWDKARANSPTTDRFFLVRHLLDRGRPEFTEFRQEAMALLGLKDPDEAQAGS